MMLAVPLPTVLIFPSSSTTATSSLSELQVTILSVASEGFTFAVAFVAVPIINLSVSRTTSTFVTSCVILISSLSLNSPHEAVISTEPPRFAVTSPLLSTEATSSSADVHTTFLSSVVFLGRHSALNCNVSPEFTVSSP